MDARFKVGDLVKGSPSSFYPPYIGTVVWVDVLSPFEFCYFVRFPHVHIETWLHGCYLELVSEEETALYVLGSDI